MHRMAFELNLQSKSTGKGHSRYITLYKTKRSKVFEKNIAAAEAVFAQRKYNWLSGQPRAERHGEENAGRRGARNYDGDVVGVSAPAIGAGNKGRAMLEKLGWTEGVGLGATHNKGILAPIAATVKTSKAGLGEVHLRQQ